MKFDFLFGQDKSPRNHGYCSVHGYVARRDIFANSNRRILVEYEGKSSNAWYDRREVEQECRREGEKLRDSVFFNTYRTALESFREGCKAFHARMWQADHHGRSTGELLSLFHDMNTQYEIAFAYFKGSRPEFTRAVEDALQQELTRKSADQGQLAEWTASLTILEELDIIKEEQLAWNALVRDAQRQSGEGTATKLLQHIRDYSWLFPEQLSLDRPLAELQHKLESDTRNLQDITKASQRIRNEQERFRAKRQDLLRHLGSEHIRYLADVIAWSGFARLLIKDCWAGLSTICATLWLEIAQRVGEDQNQLLYYYFADDVRTCLAAGRPLGKDEIKAREDYTLVYLDYPTLSVTHGPGARRRGKSLLAETLEELKTRELHGQVAFAGTARGVVRIVPLGDLETLKHAEETFQEGEILVTTMTQPNMVPLVKHAAAIVTDEGGITSHAAIISREFKIPCIVGTKIGTKVLKDGDEVELDAVKGVVRILRRLS